MGRRKLDSESRMEIASSYSAGVKPSVLSAKHGVSLGYIHSILRAHGVNKQLRPGPTYTETGLKVCFRCGHEKATTEYNKHKPASDGLLPYCKQCYKESHSTATAKYHATHKGKIKARNKLQHLLRKYGLTEFEYQSLIIGCNGRCEICGKSEIDTGMPLGIDHNHLTGKVRGVLCRQCNAGIGSLMDSPSLIREALKYLESRGNYGK